MATDPMVSAVATLEPEIAAKIVRDAIAPPEFTLKD